MAEDARTSVFQAQEAVLNFGGNEVLPEHLLIGVLHGQETPAAKTLSILGIDPEEVQAAAERLLPTSDTTGSKELVLSTAGRTIIDSAYAEAVAMQATLVRSEHFLLALGREIDSSTGKLLAEFGFDLEVARTEAKALHPMPWAQDATKKSSSLLHRGLQYFKRRKRS